MGGRTGTGMRLDQRFKGLMSDADVLSRVIGAFIPGFEGVDADDVLRMWEDGSITKLSPEMVSFGSGAMFSDVLYKVLVPGEGWA